MPPSQHFAPVRLLAFNLLVVITPAHATYPDHLVRIAVPFPPGGGTDIVMRRLGEAMATDLGQPVIIENGRHPDTHRQGRHLLARKRPSLLT